MSDTTPPAAPQPPLAPRASSLACRETEAPRLLYVEDEENDVLFLRRAFSRAELSVHLDVVTDGDQAVGFLEARPPHATRVLPRLLLLDLNLPARSGFEVLEWLRAQPALRDLPVVVFSSSGRPEDRERARTLGADDYQLKPSSPLELVALVRQLHADWLALTPASTAASAAA